MSTCEHFCLLQDSDWVETVLWRRLEPGYKCCVHVRDFLPGQTIPDQIVTSIQESRWVAYEQQLILPPSCRRVIIVLSEAYCHQQWTRMELSQARKQSLSDNMEVSEPCQQISGCGI